MTVVSLEGKTVVVTRGEAESAALRRAIEALGAKVLCVPSIRFAPADDLRAWNEAVAARRSFTHLVFTSQVAVRFFRELSAAAGLGPSAWSELRVAAIGRRTAEAVAEAGLYCHHEAAAPSAADFAEEILAKEGLGPESRVLLPRSEIGRAELAEVLEAAGVAVASVPIYQTLAADPEKAAPFLAALDAGEDIDAVTFASPSALRCFLEVTGERGERLLRDPRVTIVSIGPTTTRALRDAGLTVHATARRPGIDELVEALAAHVRK